MKMGSNANFEVIFEGSLKESVDGRNDVANQASPAF